MDSNIQTIIDQNSIVHCFGLLSDVNTTKEVRKKANDYLLEVQKNSQQLLLVLIDIFENSANEQVKFQSLLYFCNVIKRSWGVRRYNKAHSDFQVVKKEVRLKVLEHLCRLDRKYLITQFEILKYILKSDFPNNYPSFSQYVLKCIQEMQIRQPYILVFKELKEIFSQLGERKGMLPKKYFEEQMRDILTHLCTYSLDFKKLICDSKALGVMGVKMSKYCDQIILFLLRMAPIDIIDEQMTAKIVSFLLQKLQSLITLHQKCDKIGKNTLQKNIKSLIYGFGLLQSSKPLALSWILSDLYEVLLFVLSNSQSFVKNGVIRYSLIGLRRIFKQFTYYSDIKVFMASIKSKVTSANCIDLKKKCTEIYFGKITQNTIEQLLNFLISTPLFKNNNTTFLDIDELGSVQKGCQKEMSLDGCTIALIEAILQRFTAFSHHLIKGLILFSIKNEWKNLDSRSQNNLFSVLALLPATARGQDIQSLQEIPVLDILQHIYSTQTYKLRFATVVSGWLNAFSNEQLSALTEVLLNFIESEGRDQPNIDLLMGCCQCLNKIILQRSGAINLGTTIHRVVPVSLQIFQITDNPEVLWPMVNLISNIITKVEFNTQIIVKAVDPQKLSLLINNQSLILMQALCDMFKNFLCVLPRNKPAGSVYELVLRFLNNHLSETQSVNHQKIFHLWYIIIREYSSVHNCDALYTEIFLNHYSKNLYRKTSTLIYILQQYLLAQLIPSQISHFVQMIYQCYQEANQLQKDDQQQLKIASLSFQITLITKYNLEQVNSNQMMQAILNDFFDFDHKVTTPTIHNSLLSIVNRYIMIHRDAFFHFLSQLGIDLDKFIQAYFFNMNYLTSRTAMKINAITTLSIINYLDQSFILPKLSDILKLIIPQVQIYISTIQVVKEGHQVHQFIGKIDNSPSLRFASNILSQRKQEIRRQDTFERTDLLNLFRSEIHKLFNSTNIRVEQVISEQWCERLKKLM